MDLVKCGHKELENVDKSQRNVKKTTKVVMEEDKYIESIEKIIERDFFPEVTKLRAQNQYLDAVEKQDVGQLRMLSAKYQVLQTPVGAPSPSTRDFERPSTDKNWERNDSVPSTPRTNDIDNISRGGGPLKQKDDHLTLDKFLAKHTSEDNASFDTIMDNTRQKNHEKYGWLYEKENEHKRLTEQRLALPENKPGDQLMLADRPANLDNWEYTNKNALMYVPECTSLTEDERIAQSKLQEREILHTNTRLPIRFFDEANTTESMNKAAENQLNANKGKIGVDGKEAGGNETPNVNGFKFIATPSPKPGVDASPFMTWGTIEGTPFRLDAGDVNIDSTPGPTFKIPAPKKRETLALKLAEKASKRHRDERRQAQAASVIGRSPKHRNTSERLLQMSPAAQRLASERLGIKMGTDKALKSSYSPSPSRNNQGTPGRSPSLRTRNTPAKPQTPKTPSLTDNLLKLPKQ